MGFATTIRRRGTVDDDCLRSGPVLASRSEREAGARARVARHGAHARARTG